MCSEEGCGALFGAHPIGSMAEIAQLIDLIGKKLNQIKRQSVSDAGLTPAQYSVLTMLWEQGEQPFSDLADACCCSRSTVTGIVDTMEKKGLVERAGNPEDRRSVLVVLTDQGCTLRENTPTLDRMFTKCCAGITPEEMKQLSELLGKFNQALDISCE